MMKTRSNPIRQSHARRPRLRGFSMTEVMVSTAIFMIASASLVDVYMSTLRVQGSQMHQINSMTAANIALREALMTGGRDLPEDSGIPTITLFDESCTSDGDYAASDGVANSLTYSCGTAGDRGVNKIHITIGPESTTGALSVAEVCILIEYQGTDDDAYFPAGAATSFTDDGDVCAVTGAFKRLKRL